MNMRLLFFMSALIATGNQVTVALPQGSYQGSCQNCYQSGDTVSCSCKDRSGRYQNTSINVSGCNQLDNANGNLRCLGGGQAQPQQPQQTQQSTAGLPSGSYQTSCTNCYIINNELRCSCPNSMGGRNNSTLNIKDCHSDISNCSGSLKCRGCIWGF